MNEMTFSQVKFLNWFTNWSSIRVSSGSGVVMCLVNRYSGTFIGGVVSLKSSSNTVFSFRKSVYAMFTDLIKEIGFGCDVSCSLSSFFPVVMDEYRLTIFEILDVWSNMIRYIILFLVHIISSVWFYKVDPWTYRLNFICGCIVVVVFSTHDFSFNRLKISLGLSAGTQVVWCGWYVPCSIQCHEFFKFWWHEFLVFWVNYVISYTLRGK